MEVLLGAPLTIRYKLRFPRGPKISSAGELGDQEKTPCPIRALTLFSIKRGNEMTDYSNLQNAQSSQEVGALSYCKAVGF